MSIGGTVAIQGTKTVTAILGTGASFEDRIESADNQDWYPASLMQGPTDPGEPRVRPSLEPAEFVDLLLAGGGWAGHTAAAPLLETLPNGASVDDGNAATFRTAPSPTDAYLSFARDSVTLTEPHQSERTAAAPTVDLSSVLQTTYLIDTSDPIRVYIADAGDVVGGITADAASAYEQQRIMAAFATWSEVADLQFVQTTNRAEADIEVVLGDSPPYGDAQFPGGTLQVMRLSNRVSQWTDAGSLDDGGFAFAIVIHEIGHLLGLDHPHEGVVLPGVTTPFFSYGDNDLNQEVFTVMSYNRGWPTGPLGYLPESVTPYGSVYTPSPIDIAAVQNMYGANTTTGAGDSTYLLTAINSGYAAIWDVSGTDEIRHDGSSDAVIDLRAATLGFESGGGGFVSHLPAFHGGFTIANGVVIENATGGSGNDELTGNEVSNVLTGNGGNDTLHGGGAGDDLQGGNGTDVLNGNAGNDTMDGGDGADSIIGGIGDDLIIGNTGAETLDGSPGGTDYLLYDLATTQVIVRLWNNTVSGDPVAAGDTILNFEAARGGSGNDILQGNHLANTLIGNPGNDTLAGNGGDDSLYGNAGLDSIIGGFGDDWIAGGTGADFLDGSPGDSDTLDYRLATAGVNVNLWSNAVSGDPEATGDTISNFENVAGGAGNDTLTGNHLGNSLHGQGGNDTLNGSGGNDTLYGGLGADSMIGGNGNDLLLSGAGASDPDGNDTMLGSAGNDTMDGGNGADSLIGGTGDDVLFGSDGADIMDGSPGDRDTLDYSLAANDVIVRLWNNSVSGDAIAAGDTIRNFENAAGGDGNDVLIGNHLDNELSGNGGNDRLNGAGGNDTLNGGEGNDTMLGGAGQDRLFSGDGRDFLTGGADADVFVFLSAPDLGIGADRDQIMDFQQGLDQIDIAAVSAGVFEFRGTAPFAPSGNPELRLFETGTGSTIVQFDVNGDGAIDAELRVAGVTGLTAADFVL